ncbi:ASCH domain-containing protein [Streptosporangium sp. NPDC001681]|uniref:ASCH domain-containing protein n=1 Tax=Streptosporangium sp. NPDC001681 TaxID=3154395 RepID=UPI00332EE28C
MQVEHPRTVLLALKPRFANAILDGSKTVELRRQRVGLTPGTVLLIYASSPVMAILGTARVRKIERERPEDIWSQYAAHVGLHRDEYDAYLKGVEFASAITLEQPSILDKPITLKELRGEQSFHPPQSYCFINPEAPGVLGALTAELSAR